MQPEAPCPGAAGRAGVGMRFRDLLRPRQHGYFGRRTLVAAVAVLALGIVFELWGSAMSDRTLKGVGALFTFIGVVLTLGLLLRWLMLRKVG
jgi:hypothetical protein